VASRRAANKIKQWYSKERREDAIEHGREELIQALRREGLPARRVLKQTALHEISGQLNYSDDESLFAAIGEGHVSAQSFARRISEDLNREDSTETEHDRLPATIGRRHGTRRQGTHTGGVHVEGLDDIMIRLSRCCSPVPPDEIIGFVTRGRGVSVHRADCINANALSEGQPDRLIEVEWDADHEGQFATTIEIRALDRQSLLRDVTGVLADHGLDILGAETSTGDDRIATMRFEFELADVSQLDSVLSSMLSIESVYDAYRLVPGGG